jgi:hypothetical protein
MSNEGISSTIHHQYLLTLLHNLFNNHNLALPPSLSVTAALLKAGLPVSLTLVADSSASFR